MANLQKLRVEWLTCKNVQIEWITCKKLQIRVINMQERAS